MNNEAVIVTGAKETRGRLDAAARDLRDRTAMNRRMAAALYATTMRNFQRQSADGEPWAPLKPATVKWKANRGYRMILQNTGALRQSFIPFHDRAIAGVGAQSRGKPDIAAIHQYGSRDGNIPARPMLPGEPVARSMAMKLYGTEVQIITRRANG